MASTAIEQAAPVGAPVATGAPAGSASTGQASGGGGGASGGQGGGQGGGKDGSGQGAAMVAGGQPQSLPQRLSAPVQQVFAQPAVRRAMPAIIAVLAILFFLILYSVIQSPNYRVLFPGMQEADRMQALEVLNTGGFKARIDASTGQLKVPEQDYHEARIFLAGQGIPASSTAGGLDAMAEQSSMTTSQFMEQARYKAAVERELAQTISQIATLASARVHLAMTRESPFVRDRTPPKASVSVTPHQGRTVTDGQVRAIVHLVSASVPHLAPDNVAVVDNLGNLLTDRSEDTALGLTGAQLGVKRSIEADLRERVLALLTPILGEGNVRAESNVVLDFTQVETTRERFDNQNKGPMTRSEILAEERTGNLDAMGIPGSTANMPPPDVEIVAEADATEEGENGTDSNFSRRSTRNYELDRSVEYVRRATGVVERLSVAVVLNEAAIPGAEGGVVDPARLERFTELVRGAVGADVERGDRVTLITAPFEPLPPAKSPIPWWENQTIIDLAKTGLLLLVFVAILLLIVRPVVKHFLMPADAAGTGEGALAVAGVDGEISEEELGMIDIGEGESLQQIKAKLKPKKSTISADLLDTANTYDDKVALVRMIVAEDSGRVAKVFKNMVEVH